MVLRILKANRDRLSLLHINHIELRVKLIAFAPTAIACFGEYTYTVDDFKAY